jgi:hypothetical protein
MRHDERVAIAGRNGARLEDDKVRGLYDLFCQEMIGLSDSVSVEAAPFETRFATSSGMYVRVSPYRELFLVSAGSESPVEIRVCDREGFIKALDLALECFLCAASATGDFS